MTDAARLAAAVDDLYRRAVESPHFLDDEALGRWLEEVAEDLPPDRAFGRGLRKAARTARKLAAYWADRDPSRLPDWRNGVDEPLGAQGWRVQLDLVRRGLERAPTEELFAEVRERYLAVHFTEWMEGLDFDAWMALGEGRPTT